MTDVLSVQVKSITTAAVQTLYLDGEKAAWMKGKRVLIVDDVISTGDSLRALQQLVKSPAERSWATQHLSQRVMLRNARI